MGLNSIDELLNMVEIVAKRMLRSVNIPVKHVYLYILVFITLITSISLQASKPVFHLLALICGLVGFTVLTVYVLLAMHFMNKHIELSKIYYSDLRDVVTRLRIGGGEELDKKVNELLLIRRVEIEYALTALIPGYLSLLIIEDRLIFVSLVIAYDVLISIFAYLAIKVFKKHIEREEDIEKHLFSVLEISIRKEYSQINYDHKHLLLSIASLAILLVLYIERLVGLLDRHVSLHRANYESIKSNLLKRVQVNYT